jgi:hypothetical protein
MGHSDVLPVRRVHIIASCTDGKRHPVSPDLRLGSISQPLSKRLAIWCDRLQRSGADPVAAVDLYRGQHWAIVRELPTTAAASGYGADLWVASAGYGLVCADAKIRPYSATFATSVHDSVWRPTDGNRHTALRAWWGGLQMMPDLKADAPRSLTALAGVSHDTAILVIASPAYVVAMADDLAGARERLVDPHRLIVISSRHGSIPKWLAPHVVPSEAPLSRLLGGSRGSLHARTARRVLQEAATLPLRADLLIPHYARLVSEQRSTPSRARSKLSDTGIRRFISEAVAINEELTCTAALRRLRATGQACEQRRFGCLFAEVARRVHVP